MHQFGFWFVYFVVFCVFILLFRHLFISSHSIDADRILCRCPWSCIYTCTVVWVWACVFDHLNLTVIASKYCFMYYSILASECRNSWAPLHHIHFTESNFKLVSIAQFSLFLWFSPLFGSLFQCVRPFFFFMISVRTPRI